MKNMVLCLSCFFSVCLAFTGCKTVTRADKPIKETKEEFSVSLPEQATIYLRSYDPIFLSVANESTLKKKDSGRQSQSVKANQNQLRRLRDDVDYQGIPLADVLADISSRLQVSIILHPEVDKKQIINLRLRNVRLRTVLTWVLRLSHNKYLLKNEAIFVVPEEFQDSGKVIKIIPVGTTRLKMHDYYGPVGKRFGKDKEED